MSSMRDRDMRRDEKWNEYDYRFDLLHFLKAVGNAILNLAIFYTIMMPKNIEKDEKL